MFTARRIEILRSLLEETVQCWREGVCSLMEGEAEFIDQRRVLTVGRKDCVHYKEDILCSLWEEEIVFTVERSRCGHNRKDRLYSL